MTPETPGFPAVWLRHNCPCPDCRDAVTGQRLLKITDIPNGLVATVTAQHDTEIVVTFAPDGHRSVFRRDWLAAQVLAAQGGADPDPRTEDGKVLWRAADLAAPHTAHWAAYTSDDRVREGCLGAVARYGCALLRGVPVSPGMVLEVAATFGYVRETNYGRLFDVRVEPDPDNLAFTSREIAPHTDNPYRDPVPTLQLLHCLRDARSNGAVAGGDTGLVDGFAAAAALRAADPESFGVLTGTPVPFGYIDKETELTARQPLISLSPRGRIAGIRYNDRSMLPLRLPPAEAEAAYAAILVWARLLARPEFLLRLRLSPGDCLIFDNTRVLHGRTAFAATGERHLQGCYADLDGLLSTLAVLRRRQ
ncbi:MAG TPA: TauD/TfdA family dioxygenase [Trebonia sp.]|nr:TauD/TfdA family dioxygenase [Trebonia sp.]